ncbi:MAG TPA: hypothetical protein VF912_12925 [Anaeromyxobacter sp.]
MARDPRLRPFRIALWAIYLTVVAVAVGLTIRSVVKNLRGPPRPSVALPTRATLRVCVTELQALHLEQNERAWRLGAELGSGSDAVTRWQVWSREWEQRLDDLADRCRIDADEPGPPGFGGRRELAAARDAVLRLHRSYAVQVNRFAQDEANLARAAADALQAAQAAVARPPERP